MFVCKTRGRRRWKNQILSNNKSSSSSSASLCLRITITQQIVKLRLQHSLPMVTVWWRCWNGLAWRNGNKEVVKLVKLSLGSVDCAMVWAFTDETNMQFGASWITTVVVPWPSVADVVALNRWQRQVWFGWWFYTIGTPVGRRHQCCWYEKWLFQGFKWVTPSHEAQLYRSKHFVMIGMKRWPLVCAGQNR